MKKVSAFSTVILFICITAGCDQVDLYEFAKNGWRTKTPVFTPRPGAYLASQGFAGQIEISCPDKGAVIVYTTDTSGTTPPDPEYDNETGTLITGSLYTEGTPVTVAVPGVTIMKARAYQGAKAGSIIASGEFLVDQTADAPYFNLIAGAYTEPIDVEISCDTPGASIRYTTGEFDYPTETTGMIYTGSPVRITQPTYLRAIAYKAGMMSASAEAYYDVTTTTPTVETPYFSVAGGTYYTAFTVEIYCDTPGAQIYYSFDNALFDLYSAPVAINGTLTLYAYATASGMNDSAPTSISYTIDMPTVAFNSPSSTVNEPDSGNIYHDIPISLSGSSPLTVTIHYVVTSISATAGDDYSCASDTLTFNPGVTTQNILATIYPDGLIEGNETFTITLSNPVNAQLNAGSETHTVTINDTDEVKWVAVGDGVALYSNDGLSWYLGAGCSGTLRSVTTDGLTCVAVGDSNTGYFSSDGMTWFLSTGLIGNYYGVCTNRGGDWVAVGKTDPYISYSTDDGENWTAVSTASTSALNTITFDGSTWYAAGEGGLIYYTASYTGWNTYPNSPAVSGPYNLYAIAVNSFYLLTAGAGGNIYYSDDPLNLWHYSPAGSAVYLFRSVAIDGSNKCVAVDTGGNIYNTDDPAGTWTAAGTNPFTGTALYSVATDSSGTWIVVGDSGRIGISINEGVTWNIVDVSALTSANLYSVSAR